MFFSYVLYICFRPQKPWTVESSIFNLYLDLKFTLRMKRQHFQRETMVHFLLPSCTSSHWFPRCPLPDLPQFESNHQCPIGCSDHVTYIGPISTAFLDWSRIFPWELPTEPVQCVCVCLSMLGKNLPPSSPLSPFLSPFFHHLPSFETQYHTLDSLCCHGKEHSFSGMATRSVRIPWKTQKEPKTESVRKCRNAARALNFVGLNTTKKCYFMFAGLIFDGLLTLRPVCGHTLKEDHKKACIKLAKKCYVRCFCPLHLRQYVQYVPYGGVCFQ